MEPFFAIADLYSRTALHNRADSALPNAPVLPDKERRARVTSLLAALRGQAHRPRVEIRRARYSPECSTP